MINFLLNLLMFPEAQADPHYWISVLLAHAFVGIVGMAVLGWILGKWQGLLAVATLYAFWEFIQFLIFNGTLTDGAVDWSAVFSGAVIALSAWSRKGLWLALALGVLSIIGVSGVRSRK